MGGLCDRRYIEMTMKIVPYPHPAMRYAAKPVTTIDKELRLLAGQMLELMYAHKGLGLAAPQVAMPVHLLVMNFEGDPENKEAECVAVNPVILSRKGTQDGQEGCLSFPDLYQNVRRAKEVVIQAYDLQGRQFEMTSIDLSAQGLAARDRSLARRIVHRQDDAAGQAREPASAQRFRARVSHRTKAWRISIERRHRETARNARHDRADWTGVVIG